MSVDSNPEQAIDMQEFLKDAEDKGVELEKKTVSIVTSETEEYSIFIDLLNMILSELKEHGFWVVGTSLENSQDYRSVDYTGKIVLIIGNENNGISKLVSDNCDYLVKIPMFGHVDSLNASVSASILIYEIIKYHKN